MGVMKRIIGDGRSVRAVWRKSAVERKMVGMQTIPGLANNELPEIRLRTMNAETMKLFMPIFKERLKRNLVEQNIGYEGDLDDSLRESVKKSGDGVMGTLSFNFYGRFVDWGVGKGTSLMEAQSGIPLAAGRLTARRRAKPWFGPQYAHELKRIAELTAANTQQVLAEMAAQMNVQVEIKI